MDNKELKAFAAELMEAARAHGLAELELETDEVRIAMKFPCAVLAAQPPAAPALAGAGIQPAAPEPVQPAAPEIVGTRVEAPLVGIFYSSPSPEEPPFIEVGQQVHKGDRLFIIEAMKTMNEITAPCDGTVSRIFVQNGDMVEFHQLLVVIE